MDKWDFCDECNHLGGTMCLNDDGSVHHIEPECLIGLEPVWSDKDGDYDCIEFDYVPYDGL